MRQTIKSFRTSKIGGSPQMVFGQSFGMINTAEWLIPQIRKLQSAKFRKTEWLIQKCMIFRTRICGHGFEMAKIKNFSRLRSLSEPQKIIPFGIFKILLKQPFKMFIFSSKITKIFARAFGVRYFLGNWFPEPLRHQFKP